MIKTGVIAATVLACIFGVIGFPTSLKQAEDNAGQRIHLGLDLNGGTYLILQVHVQDAAKTRGRFADRESCATKRRDAQHPGRQLSIATIRDPQRHRFHPDQRQRRGSAEDAGFRTMVADKAPDWILTPVNSTDYRLNMKPTRAARTEAQHCRRSRSHTIERRVNALGLDRSRPCRNMAIRSPSRKFWWNCRVLTIRRTSSS